MYQLEFTDNEIRIVLNALDLYSRIWIGQYDQILWDLRWYRKYNQLDALDESLRRKMKDMRNIILPGLQGDSLSASYGIFSPDRDVKAAVAYDMQQEFRYRRAWFLSPNGGYTVDFRKPLPCEDDPCVYPKAECFYSGGEFRIKIQIDDIQLGVIIDALNIRILEYNCQIRKLFEYFTKDQEALYIAEELMELVLSTEEDQSIKDESIKKLDCLEPLYNTLYYKYNDSAMGTEYHFG